MTPRLPPPKAATRVRLTVSVSADKARRLHEAARQRGLSISGLLDEAASIALFDFEASQRVVAPSRPDGGGTAPTPDVGTPADRSAAQPTCQRP